MQAGVGLNLLGATFNQGSTLVVNVAVANLLGREAFGRYTMVLATLTTVAAIGQLSMGYTATKHVAEFRSVQPETTSRILGLCAVVSFAAAGIVGLVLGFGADWLARDVLGAPELGLLLRVSAAAVFFTILNGFSSGALAGLESYAALAKAGVASGIAYTIVCIVLTHRYGLLGAVAGVTLSALVQTVLLGVLLTRETARHGLRISYRGAWRERAVFSNFAIPASLTGLISLPAIWIASAILGRQPGGYQQLALFGAANSFRTMVLFVPQAINNVGMSLLNNQRRVSADGYRRVFWMNGILTAGAAVVTAGFFFLAGGRLLQLFGPAFAEGRSALAILLGAAVIEAIAVATYQIVVSQGRIWASLVCVSLPRDVTLVLLAATLAPLLGAAGLATAYAAAWTLALLGILALVYRQGVPASRAEPVSAR